MERYIVQAWIGDNDWIDLPGTITDDPSVAANRLRSCDRFGPHRVIKETVIRELDDGTIL